MFPDWFRRRKPSGPEVLVYINLAAHGTWNPASGTYDECRPSVPTIAEETELSENTVRKALRGLLEHGALQAGGKRYDEKGGQLPTVYRAVFGLVVAPPQNLNPPTAESEGEGVQKNTPPGVPNSEGNQEPSTKNQDTKSSFDAEASPTAQTIIRGFIDWLALPEQSAVQLTKRVIGIYAKTIKQLLGEGFEEILIKRALVEMHQRGMTGRPTLLEGFVVQVQNRPVSAPPASRPKLFEEMREDRTAQRKTRSQMIDATMDRLKVENPGMGIAEVVRQAADMVDAHLKDHSDQLKGRTVTGYIDGDVIDNASKEVTGSAA